MKRFVLVLFATAICCFGCSDGGDDSVEFSFMWPNALYHLGDDVYIVDSGNNEIDVYHPENGKYENGVIRLPVDSNPVRVTADADNVYIVAEKSGKIYQYHKADGVLKTVAENLNMPYSIEKLHDCFVVANSEYDYNNGTAAGSVAKICDDNSNSVPTACKNPVSIRSFGSGYLLSCSGVYQYDGNYNIMGTEGSALQLLDESFSVTKSVLENEDTGTVDFSDKYIVEGSAFTGTIRLFDNELKVLDTYKVDSNEPVMMVPQYLYDDLFAVANFNKDQILIFRAKDDKLQLLKTIQIESTDVAKKGPIDMVYVDDKLIVLNSIDNSLDIFEIAGL